VNDYTDKSGGRFWHRLSSRAACRVYLWCFAVLFTSGLALRIEAAVYARQIASTVTELSTLRLGETSKADVLLRIPGLRPSASEPRDADHSSAEECLFASIRSGLPGRILSTSDNTTFNYLLRWWGFRFEGLDIAVNFTSGRVSYFSYRLTVSAPGVMKSVPPPPVDGELGAVVIGVSSQSTIDRTVPNSPMEEHPPYTLTPSRAVPSQSISIALTPNAPEELVRSTFDLKLHCLWSWGGCRRWNELLPGVKKQMLPAI
jgi:hypothetical protein